MEKWVLMFLALFTLRTLNSQDTSEWVSIDCGSETSYTDGNGIKWNSDEGFINTGKNKQVSSNGVAVSQQMDSLRIFTQQNKNCYSLPVQVSVRYFIRAGFYYGNYDGLSKPPTFNLEFDGNKWATIVTSIKEPVYEELIYTVRGDNISVCLARTSNNEFPFISSLEALPLPDKMYDGMTRDLAWFKSYRFHFGGTDVIGYPDDTFNRIWEPSIPSDLVPVTADFTYIIQTTVDYPPDSALLQAVESPNSTAPINLSFLFDQSNRFNYLSLYYIEVSELVRINDTRSFTIQVDGLDLGLTISPRYEICDGAWAKTKSTGNLNVDLSPTVGSTLPPVISAIEVYTASDPLVTTGTSQDDLDGLADFTNAFEQLQGWSGDPCLPSDTVWQWLNCNGTDPPTVTALHLSGYSLDGLLPQFNQMQSLQIIDLSNNSLDGPIPYFLGNLPNLRELDLSNNNFSGDIPQNLKSNRKITYTVNGNPLLPHKGSKKGLIIGLAVGLPLGLAMVAAVLFLIYHFYWRKNKPAQAPVTVTELGNHQEGADAQTKPQVEDVSISVNAGEPTNTSSSQGDLPVSVNGGEPAGPTTGHMHLGGVHDLLSQHFRANGEDKAK